MKKTLPRKKWKPFNFWLLKNNSKLKQSINIIDPSDLALLWRDTANAKSLRYITFNGKYLVVKNV